MNEDQSSIKRPVLCIVNGKRAEGEDFPFRLNISCNIIELQSLGSEELLERLDYINPDCVVMDMDDQGCQFNDWTELREYCEMRHIPVVVMNGRKDRETKSLYWTDAVYCQPIDPEEAGLHIQLLIRRRERILDQILIDPLTGVFNYRYLRYEVDKQLNDMNRSHDTFSMVYMDVDLTGSKYLKTKHLLVKSLVDFIHKSIRPTDCLAHYFSKGFVLVLPKTIKEDAIKLMHRLTESFSKEPIETDRGPLYATFSSKVLEFADANQTAEDCLRLMAFTDQDPAVRSGLVLDGTSNEMGCPIRKLKLAIIDDDRLIREMLRHQLADIGGDLYDVELRAFADGEAFFNDPWHKQNERYLLIIDRIMPKMDGLEILQKIRTGYDRRRYLCMMVSSRKAEADIALAIQRGANDYLVKPFSLKELRARILRLIGGLR